jgi:ferredoxin-NADP reductase
MYNNKVKKLIFFSQQPLHEAPPDFVKGRITAKPIDNFLQEHHPGLAKDFEIFCCGPNMFMDAMQRGLGAIGYTVACELF